MGKRLKFVVISSIIIVIVIIVLSTLLNEKIIHLSGGSGPEICNNGIDDDLDGDIDCADLDCKDRDDDKDGYLSCPSGSGIVSDCDDNDINVNPGEVELGADVCSDGKDNDCSNGADCSDYKCNGEQAFLPKVLTLSPTGICCSGIETDVNFDAINCGGCGISCLDNEVCIEGSCLSCSTISDPAQCYDIGSNYPYYSNKEKSGDLNGFLSKCGIAVFTYESPTLLEPKQESLCFGITKGNPDVRIP